MSSRAQAPPPASGPARGASTAGEKSRRTRPSPDARPGPPDARARASPSTASSARRGGRPVKHGGPLVERGAGLYGGGARRPLRQRPLRLGWRQVRARTRGIGAGGWRTARGREEREEELREMRGRERPGGGLGGGGPTRLRVERGRAEETFSAQLGTAQLIEPG
jgi:hypothetical protein